MDSLPRNAVRQHLFLHQGFWQCDRWKFARSENSPRNDLHGKHVRVVDGSYAQGMPFVVCFIHNRVIKNALLIYCLRLRSVGCHSSIDTLTTLHQRIFSLWFPVPSNRLYNRGYSKSLNFNFVSWMKCSSDKEDWLRRAVCSLVKIHKIWKYFSIDFSILYVILYSGEPGNCLRIRAYLVTH